MNAPTSKTAFYCSSEKSCFIEFTIQEADIDKNVYE